MALRIDSTMFWGTLSTTTEIGTGDTTATGQQAEVGVSDRVIPLNPVRFADQIYGATPQITAHRLRDNTIVITKIVAVNTNFFNRDNGYAGMGCVRGNYGYYQRIADGGWRWVERYHYQGGTTVAPNYTVGLGNVTFMSTQIVLAPGQSTGNLDWAYSTNWSGFQRNCYINLTNTYTKPNPSPPTISCSGQANTSNGNTINFSAKYDCGYCNTTDKCDITYTIRQDSVTGTILSSGSGASKVQSGLSPNTRYYYTWNINNGCFEANCDGSAVTVTPNTLSEAKSPKWDIASVRLAVTNGGGEYEPTTTIWLKKCTDTNWTQVATSTTKAVETINLSGLDPETCYQVQARTTTPAGTYTGNTETFTTPKKGLLIANFTNIDVTMNEKNYNVCANLCYKWETLKVPGTLRIYYRVKDGYDDRWYYVDADEITELEGEGCLEVCDLYPNQTVYETYIRTETEDGVYESDMWEFITPVVPEPEIYNCENFDYLTALVCQAVVALYQGNKEIYANDCSKEMCDPYSQNPTYLTLMTRILREFHAMYCLLCDMGGARFAASKPGQYLVGEAGWQDILTEIKENDPDSWKIATSDAIMHYITKKLHTVWHYHDAVDYLVYDLADLDQFPDATSAIVTSENAVYHKVAGAWVKSTDEKDKVGDMSVWHIKYESRTQAGYVQAGSAWYYWNGVWQPMDADVVQFAQVVDEMWEKRGQASSNEVGADRMHINTVDRLQYNCSSLPNGERWVTMITEPLVVPAPGYYEIAFETGEQATIIQTQQVLSGAMAQRPEDPTRTGYIFQGWNDKATGAAYNWSMPVTRNIVIEAIWAPQPVTVTFDIGKATGTAPATITTVYGATINPLPDDSGFMMEGGSFLGWKRDGVIFTPATPLVGDTTLVAYYAMDEFDVTFHPENGNSDTVVRLNYGEGVSEPTAPTKADSVFVGWFTSPNAGTGTEFVFNAPLYGDTDVYARWVAAEYIVAFDSAGGTAVPSQTVAYQGTASVPTPNPTKDGVVFGHWMLNGQPYIFNSPVVSDITLVAKWLSIFTVEFLNTEDETISPTQTVVYGEGLNTLTISVPARPGYAFEGWYDKDTGQRFNVDTDVVVKDMTLVAIYKQETS